MYNPDAFVYIIAEDSQINCIKRTKNIQIINKNQIPNFGLEHHPNTHENKMIMSRCWLSKILNEDKVLYLDIDTLVLGSLEDLWNTDIENYAIAAWAEDKNESLVAEYFMAPRRRMRRSKYVNSGVVLFNLKFIRERGIDDQ